MFAASLSLDRTRFLERETKPGRMPDQPDGGSESIYIGAPKPLKYGLNEIRHPLVEVREHLRPSFFVPILRLLIRKACMRETEQCAVAIGHQCNAHHCLGALGGGGDPRQFHPSIAIQAEEPTVEPADILDSNGKRSDRVRGAPGA